MQPLLEKLGLEAQTPAHVPARKTGWRQAASRLTSYNPTTGEAIAPSSRRLRGI